ncbi:SOS response-associated peptidase family protein [Arthrobacter flavus]|uniref:SOS response-associated peptidase family protein n=1 Tax=Arthrobacter flavus TaxID=95172 RepID=A0ABW4Q7L4_9MICC
MSGMCGRFVIAGNKQALLDTFEVITDQSADMQPSWNVAPMQDIRFITERPDADGVLERRLEAARWGLVPVWSKDPKAGARILCTSAGK